MNLKQKALNATVSVTKGMCGVLHSSLFYAIKGVENTEIAVVKRATGELPKDIRNDRRKTTIAAHQLHREMADKAKQKLDEFMSTTHTRTMTLIHEVSTFNRTTEIIVDEN